MNSFGRIFRVSIFGESHGETIGAVIDGVPAGMALCEEEFLADLARRKSGARGTTPRRESDSPQLVSGLFEGRTTGAPLTVLFRNENRRSGDYADLRLHPRPSHADWTAALKYGGFNDYRGGGHFSGRLTLPLTAAGTVAKKILSGTEFRTSLVEVGGCCDPQRFAETVESALRDGDSVGGVVECRVRGVEPGLGEPFFDGAESVLAHLLFSIPAVKGVEFGAGFASARMRGSQNNDPIADRQGHTATNHAGGICGGITNNNELTVRVAVKPTPSISCEQRTWHTGHQAVEPLIVKGRHDACIALRAGVVVEAAVAIGLADLHLLRTSAAPKTGF